MPVFAQRQQQQQQQVYQGGATRCPSPAGHDKVKSHMKLVQTEAVAAFWKTIV